MGTSQELINRAANIGRYAANNEHVTGAATISSAAHHPGDDTGRLVLEAYRRFGASAVREVVEAYQGGFNNQAAENGDPVISRIQIKNGIGSALPGASDEEIRAIEDEL